MDVRVDQDLCQSFAVCVGVAPEYFELDEGGDLVLLRESVDPDDEDTLGEAAMICPRQAILLAET
ncbi:ferredoxin [Monashia sp. NPDC004114]